MPRLSYESIQKQIEKLQAQAKKLEASHLSRKLKSVAQVRALMKKLNVSVSDLQGASQEDKPKSKRLKGASPRSATASSQKRAAVAPKYRHPETMQTWTGRGKAPIWLASLLAQGHRKEDYLISPSSSDSVTSEAQILSDSEETQTP